MMLFVIKKTKVEASWYYFFMRICILCYDSWHSYLSGETEMCFHISFVFGINLTIRYPN